jgi:hypothetical protein
VQRESVDLCLRWENVLRSGAASRALVTFNFGRDNEVSVRVNITSTDYLATSQCTRRRCQFFAWRSQHLLQPLLRCQFSLLCRPFLRFRLLQYRDRSRLDSPQRHQF